MRVSLNRLVTLAAFSVAVLTTSPPSADAQSTPSYGRFSLFAQTGERTWADGGSSSFTELIANFSVHSPRDESDGIEYSVDARMATMSASESRRDRYSIYNAFVGMRTAGGRLNLRLGQMWLNEFGGLGSLGGLFAEYRGKPGASGLRLRFGLFGGAEPKLYDAGYAENVLKGGVFVALDGESGRKHVLGWVLLRNSNLTERSVVTMQNFVPISTKFFLYQAAEYDLDPPGGLGQPGLNYLFANARWAPVRAFEIQGTFHHGRSIDARTITEDELNGRPVDPSRAEGYLFESARARVTFRLGKRVRVWGGLGRDRNNRDEESHGRALAGLSVTNLIGSGFDVSASTNRYDRTNGSFNSYYASLGRSFGSRVYVTLDFNSSLNVVRVTDGEGITVEDRPESTRLSLSGNIRLSRRFSLLLTGERFEDEDSQENRLMTGLSFRF